MGMTVEVTKEVAEEFRRLQDKINGYELQIMELDSKIRRLEKGEYTCKRCGLRKDSEFEKGDF